MIALILCLTTLAKNQFTAPTLSDFSETKYKLNYTDLLVELGLLAPMIMTSERVKNTIVLIGFYKLY